MARLNAENIKNFLYELNEKQIPKKRFNSKIIYNGTEVLFLFVCRLICLLFSLCLLPEICTLDSSLMMYKVNRVHSHGISHCLML